MEIRVVAPDDLDALYDLRCRAFGPHGGDWWRREALADAEAGLLLGVYDGARLVASGKHHLFDQWWHGRAVPMGGVAAVCVAPEDRGRGVGRLLIPALLESMRGLPLSTLYPATAPVYRAAGYEHAGVNHRVTMRPEALRTLTAGRVPVRQAVPGDAAQVTALLRRVHAEARECGPIDRGEEFVRGTLANEEIYTYLADDGFLAYAWRDGTDRIAVLKCVAGSEETARALWSIVGTGSSVAETVDALVGPEDPLLWLLRDRSIDQVRRESWMLRVLDLPAAVAARGFPAGVTAEVPLAVDDDALPGNSGAFTLTVAGGRGHLEPAPEHRDAVRLPARGVAALYAGVPMAALRRSGLAAGGGDGDASLDAAFAGTAYMLDNF